MQQLEVFHAHEEWSYSSVLGVTHRVTSTSDGETKKYSCASTDRVMRLLSSLTAPLNNTLIEQHLPPEYGKDTWRTRLALCWPSASDDISMRREAQQLAVQYGKIPAPDASQFARETLIHFLYDYERERLIAIFSTVYVENADIARCVARFMSSPPNWAEGNELQDRDVPICNGWIPLPNTGHVKYVFSAKCPNGTIIEQRELGLSAEQLFCQELVVRRAVHSLRSAEVNWPMIRSQLSRAGKGGMKLSKLFTRYCVTFRAKQRALERSSLMDDADGVYDIEDKHAQYAESVRSKFQTVIDLQDTEKSWAPNAGGEFVRALLQLVKSGARGLEFSDACDFMNQFMAKERPPGTAIWYKAPGNASSGENERGCKLIRSTVNDFKKDSGIAIKLKAPEDPDTREIKLRGVPIDKDSDDFLWMRWYLQYGCREVIGPRFMPLSLGESVTDAEQVSWINTFRGFRCHAWLVDEQEKSVTMALRDSQLSDSASDLNFLLRHVKDLAGGSDEAARIIHGWIAHLCFRPAFKAELPLMLIFMGPPGCGKSSFVQKMGEWLLNSAHIVTVTNARHLIGHFNRHTEEKVLCAAEEFDLKDQRKEENQALQELVSGKTVFGEQKGVDGEMRRSHTRYVLCTNADHPVITNPNNRKFMLLAYDILRAVYFERDEQSRNAHLARLARVLDDLSCWRAYAGYLFTEFYFQLETWAASIATRRHFNHTTLRTQLVCLWAFAEWSVLAFLFHFVEKRIMFVNEGHNCVYYDEKKPTRFLEWENWAAMMQKREPDERAVKFGAHSWSVSHDEGAKNWWQKMQCYRLYCLYRGSVPSEGKHRAPILSEADFYYSLERILMADTERPAMLRDTYVGTVTQQSKRDGFAGTTQAEARDWLALAPLDRLEQVIEHALPASMGFSWSEYRKQEELVREARRAAV